MSSIQVMMWAFSAIGLAFVATIVVCFIVIRTLLRTVGDFADRLMSRDYGDLTATRQAYITTPEPTREEQEAEPDPDAYGYIDNEALRSEAQAGLERFRLGL